MTLSYKSFSPLMNSYIGGFKLCEDLRYSIKLCNLSRVEYYYYSGSYSSSLSRFSSIFVFSMRSSVIKRTNFPFDYCFDTYIGLGDSF